MRLKTTLAAVFASLAALPVTAELPPLIPRKVLFGNPQKVNVQISPDGKMLSYLAPVDGVRNVWVRTVGRNDDRAVTSEKKRDISAYFWRGDSQHVFHIQDIGGDENFHLFMTDVKTSTSKDLTPFSGVRADIVSADPRHPDEVLVSLNKRDKRLFDVHRINLKTGEMTVDTENPGDVGGWTADNANQVRAAIIYSPGGEQIIRLRKDAKSAWVEFEKWGANETFGGVIGFSPDNNKAWVFSSVDANTLRFVEVDPETKVTKVLGADPTFDVTTLITHPKTNALEAVGFMKAKLEWKFVEPTVEKAFVNLQKVRAGQVNINSRSLDDKKWVVAYTTDDGPIYFYLYDKDSGKAEYLFSNRPELEKYKLAKMEPVSFKSRDGLDLHGYLTMPLGMKKAPIVMLVHGGPWGRDSWGYSSLVQMLANRGYGVLQVNFRGSTGYGKAFVNAGDREWAGKMHDDLIDAKQWAVKQGYTDAGKVAIMGGSYGGYATLVGLTFTPNEFACGVDIVGPSNIYTLLSTIPPYWATLKSVFDKRVGQLGKDDDFLRSRSPLFKADQIKKPLLIGQGANDPRVKQAESDQIVKAMRDNKLPVEYVVFPDEGHGFVRPENSLRFFAAADEFLSKCLGGRSESPSEAEDWSKFTK
jgi:dipeptidyl aminopeptidase/acylaminoacyl peptidase